MHSAEAMYDPRKNPPRPLPKYSRAEVPPPFRPTAREFKILEVMHYKFDGIMTDIQIANLLFDSHSRMKARMSKLFHHAFVDRLNAQERAQFPFMVYSLDAKGAMHIANREGIPLEEISWRKLRERFELIRHDCELNAVKIAALKALEQLPGTRIEAWINSRSFWAHPDQVEYKTFKGQSKKRYLRPDWFLHVVNPGTWGERHSRFFVEYDRATEDNPRFLEEKVLPGLAYMQSKIYKDRFGFPARWLVVTTGETRLRNMKRHAEKVTRTTYNPAAFYFTTYAKTIQPGAFFTQKIWRRATVDEPVALFSNAD